jgi:hypothetical protein
VTDTRPTQLAADIISGIRGFRVTISPEHTAAIAIARLVEQARQEERARCVDIAECIEADGLQKNLGSVLIREIIQSMKGEI